MTDETVSRGAGDSGASRVRPRLAQTVLDTPDPRGLAEFYRELLGFTYRPGDEPPPSGEDDVKGRTWLTLRSGRGAGLAFQHAERLARTTWPDPTVPQQAHLDCAVESDAELFAVHEHALALGARLLLDESDHPDEHLFVYADPAGHPFCVFVSPSRPE